MKDWTNLIGSFGNTAAGVIGAIKGPRTPATATVADTEKTLLPIALIGGGVLLVIGLFVALRK